MKRTSRGFSIYADFTDTRGCRVRVQQSSSVQNAVWVFCVNEAGSYTERAKDADISPHLTPAQARQLAKALLKFADETTDGR